MTFGPTYDETVDGPRLNTQMLRIRDFMLSRGLQWLTLDEIQKGLEGLYRCRFPAASISAQLRHLKKKEFGSHILDKRRRGATGLYEYRLTSPQPAAWKQEAMFEAHT